MHLRRVWLPCLLGSAFGTGACSLLLPFDELSDGARDAAVPVDATSFDVGVDQATPPEAGVDAPPVETSIPDAGVDAPAPVDAGALYPDGSWCSTQAPGMVLCDDFDYEDGGFQRWTTKQFDVLGAAGFSDVAESPPHSFEIDMPAVSPSTFYVQSLEEVLPPAGTSSLSLSFSFQPAVPIDSGSYQPYIASISQGPGAPRYALGLNVGPGGVNFTEQDTAADGDASFPPEGYVQTILPSGTWTHIVIDIDLAAETASLSFDGSVVATLSLKGAWSPSATTTVYLGDWYISPTTGFDVLFDDVVIRRQ